MENYIQQPYHCTEGNMLPLIDKRLMIVAVRNLNINAVLLS